VFIRRRQFSA